MEILKQKEIETGLQEKGRVYLCGNLSQPNGVQHIQTDGYEIGMSFYAEYTFEKAHIHAQNQEYNYVLEGAMKIFLLSEKKEYLFQKGDFFVIQVNEPYVGKSMPGTKTLFSKVPGGNDKVLVPMNNFLIQWGKSWESIYTEE